MIGGETMYLNKMKKIRAAKNITLKDLSNMTGISIGYLCHLEKGTRKNPSMHVMEKIAKELGESVSTVFF